MAGLGETVADFFSREAGQDRRRWLDEKSGAIEKNGIPYYALPGGYITFEALASEEEPGFGEVLAPPGGT